MSSASAPNISIVIKALNEEARITACIESALVALEGLSGEVILADSGSTDRTLEYAQALPIRIVQLADFSERRCGIGPQLGYQVARGEFIYILDGDMLLQPGFLQLGLDALERDSSLAGVAGLVEEHSAANMQFRSRRKRNDEGVAGIVDWLGMGGLYRRAAIDCVGYLSNRNLYAHEEQELGLRLINKGWRLQRIAYKSVDHFGHVDATLELLAKRWKSGYLFGSGQLLRAGLGQAWFWSAARTNAHNLVALGLWAGLVAGLLTLPWSDNVIKLWAVALAAVFVQRLIRHRSLRDSALCMLVWHVNAIALLVGFFKSQTDPMKPIGARTLKT